MQTHGIKEDAILRVIKVAELLTRIGNAKVFGGKLTQAQFNVLMVLKRHSETTMAQKEILQSLVSTKGNLSIHINNLAEAGYICKRVSALDNRVNEISLTSKGREMLAELEPSYLKHLREITGLLSEEQAELIIESLTRIECKCQEMLGRGSEYQ